MKLWYVAETVRNRQDEAALSVAPLGMEAYVPAIVRVRKRGHHMVEEEEPRFGTYIFLRFDRMADPWPELIHGVSRKKYFQRILSNSDGVPIPVPNRAMEAIMAWKPPRIGDPIPITYQPGQLIRWTVAGKSQEGVFVGYKGKRQYIRTWIMGAEHICEVRTSDLEPVEVRAA